MTANYEATGLGTSKNPCPFCGKKNWQMWGRYLGEWILESENQCAIVDWKGYLFGTTEEFMLAPQHLHPSFTQVFGATSVDVCLSCGAQVQG